MSLPVLAARGIASRIGPLLSSASVGTIKQFKNYLAAHPALTSTFASLGVSGVIDAAMNGDENSIQALNDAAAAVGIVEGGQPQSTSLMETVVDQVGSLFSDPSSVEISDSEAERAQQLKTLARFVRTEISGDPRTVLRFHAMMNEFLSMDTESVENLVKAY